MNAYKYPTRRAARGKQIKQRIVAAQQKAGTVGLIQGRTPGSYLEWLVARALWKLKIDFRYQVPVYGGREMSGGQVVDFVINSSPQDIPLQVYGRRWHSGGFAIGDKFKLQQIERIYKRPAVVLWDDQLQTEEMALSSVRKALNL
jgi:hypothetical protein